MLSTRSRPATARAEAASARPRLSLSVQYAHQLAQVPSRAQFRRWVSAALAPLSLEGKGVAGEGERVLVTLRLVDDAEGRALNRDFRGKDYATNVLTFAYGQDEFGPSFSISGDIILCTPVVEREAREQGRELLAHYAHLAVHGMLHLQGYDHETEREAVIMEGKETAILAKLGFSNPYAGEK